MSTYDPSLLNTAVELVGVVYYAADPQKRIFRIVHPSDPARLDGPALETDPASGALRIMSDEYGPHGWHTFGVHPQLRTVFEKIDADELPKRNHGSLLEIEKELAGAE